MGTDILLAGGTGMSTKCKAVHVQYSDKSLLATVWKLCVTTAIYEDTGLNVSD